MESGEKLQIKQQQFQNIVTQIKQWYKENDIHFQIEVGETLFKILRNAYNKYMQQVGELQKDNKQLREKLSERNEMLMEFEKQIVEFKLTLQKYQQQKKENLLRREQSTRLLETQKRKLIQQQHKKEQTEKQNQQLARAILLKQQEIGGINKNVKSLKAEMIEIKQKNQRLIKSITHYKSQSEKYKNQNGLLTSSYRQLQEEIKSLRIIVDKNKQYNSYCTIIKSENSIEVNSFDGDLPERGQNLGFLRQIENNDEIDEEFNKQIISEPAVVYEKPSEISIGAISFRSNSNLNISYLNNQKKRTQRYRTDADLLRVLQNKDQIQSPDRKRSQHNYQDSFDDFSKNKSKFLRNIHYKDSEVQCQKNSGKSYQSQFTPKNQDLHLKVQFFKDRLSEKQRVIIDLKKDIIELKMEKQYFKALTITQQNENKAQQKAIKLFYSKEVEKFLQKERTKMYEKFKMQLSKLTEINNQLTQKKLLQQKIRQQEEQQQQKRKKFSLALDDSYSYHLEHRQKQEGRNNISLQFGIIEGQKDKILDQNSKILEDFNEDQSGPNSVSVQVQTEDVFCFYNEIQAYRMGYKKIVFQDEQIQTIRNQYNKEVAIQVNFSYLEVQVQTQVTQLIKLISQSFIDKSFQTQTAILDQSQAQTQTIKIKHCSSISIQTNQVIEKNQDIQVIQSQNIDIQTDTIVKSQIQCQSYYFQKKLSQTDYIQQKDCYSQSKFQQVKSVQTIQIQIQKTLTCSQTQFNQQKSIQTERKHNFSIDNSFQTEFDIDTFSQTNQCIFQGEYLNQQSQTQIHFCKSKQTQTNNHQKKHEYSQSQFQSIKSVQTIEKDLPTINISNQTQFEQQKQIQTQRKENHINANNYFQTEFQIDASAQTDQYRLPKGLLEKQSQTKKDFYQCKQIQTYFKQSYLSQTQIPLQIKTKKKQMQISKQIEHKVNESYQLIGPKFDNSLFSSPQRILNDLENQKDFDVDKHQGGRLYKKILDNSLTHDKTIHNSTMKDNETSFKKVKQNNSDFEFDSFQQKHKNSDQNNFVNQHSIKLFENLNNITSISDLNNVQNERNKQKIEPSESQSEQMMILNDLDQSSEVPFQFGRDLSFEDQIQNQGGKFQIQLSPSSKSQHQDNQSDSWDAVWQLIDKNVNIKENSFKDQQLPIQFSPKKVYLFKVHNAQDHSIEDELVMWAKGIFSLRSKQYLKTKDKVITSNDSNMYMLGNSELVLRLKDIWVRKKSKYSYLQGNMTNANWKAISCKSYFLH